MLGSLKPEGFLRPAKLGGVLDSVSHLLTDADLTLGNLEGALCDTGRTDKCPEDSLKCYAFRMPANYADQLAGAGFDMLSMANNHAGDYGLDGIECTQHNLDRVGIAWSGVPESTADTVVNGLSVAFIAFHSGGFTNSSLDIESATAHVEKLDGLHDIVLVSVHGGAEGLRALTLPDSMEYYLGEPRGHLIAFARHMVDAGADLVFGHGPHVPRAAEIYGGRLIAYSLGNFATYGRFNLQSIRRFGGILEVEMFADGSLSTARFLSVEQKYWGVPVPDPAHRFAMLVDSLSAADLPASGVDLAGDGQLTIP